MRVEHLWLTDVRGYAAAELVPAPGLTAVVGPNGSGKTNLIEAVGWLATLTSFRGAPTAAMVRSGCERGVIRARIDQSGREVLVEAELRPAGRDRVQVNRQPLKRARDLLGVLRVTVFSPDDLELVKGGPGGRRRLLDELLVALHPRAAAVQADVERVLRQRTALLRQAGGRATPDVAATLDVWDAKLAERGEELGRQRAELATRLEPLVARAYGELAGAGTVGLRYEPAWRATGLAAALAAARTDDLRRGVCTVGPHRDDVELAVAGMPARTHASQGEQRSLALALRLAGHGLVQDTTGHPPVLLLDDVFSELDEGRSAALLAHLPPGQAILTTAGALPAGTRPDKVVRVRAGRLLEEAA